MNGSFTASLPAAMIALSKRIVFFSPVRSLALARRNLDFDVMRIDEAADAVHDLDLAHLRHPGEARRELLHDAVLEAAQLADVDRGRRIRDAVIAERGRLVDHRRGVQQRLRRNAADVQADAAERVKALDQHRVHPEVRRAKCRRITARTRAEHEHFAFDVGAAGVCSRRCRRARAARRRCRWRGGRRRGVRAAGGDFAAGCADAVAASVVNVRIALPSDTLSPT